LTRFERGAFLLGMNDRKSAFHAENPASDSRESNVSETEAARDRKFTF